MSSAFTTETLDLSMSVGGRKLTASVYCLDDVKDADGRPRKLSMGELVMAVCLERAAEMEGDLVSQMAEMESNSEKLERLTSIEKTVLAGGSPSSSDSSFLRSLGISGTGDELVTAIESKLDSLNAFSQESLISIQRSLNKRDQEFDLLSNIIKAFYSAMVGNVNNM